MCIRDRILPDFDPPLGVPKLAQIIQKRKKSEAKKNVQNRPSSEPPKMSSGYLWLSLTLVKGVRVLATLSQENPNFAWKVLHFCGFLHKLVFQSPGGD